MAEQSSWAPSPHHSPQAPLPNEVSCSVSTCVSSDNSFLNVRREPTLGPWKGAFSLQYIQEMCVCVCVCTHCHSVMSKSLQLPGSSVHGILEARILEWVAIPFYRGSSQPRDQNPCLTLWQVGSLPLSQPRNIIWEVYMWLNFCLTPANMSYYGNG